MPESRTRKKNRPTKDKDGFVKAGPAAPKESPRWWAPTMVTLMVVGLVSLVVTYLFQGNLPVPGWGNNNLWLGFGLLIAGFLMTTRWR